MPESLVTRPLRTGRNFRVVIPQHRVFLLRWDKAEYEAGAEAELSIQGRHLGPDPLELRVEQRAGGGSWGPAASLRAQVDGDRSHARCKWKFPDEGTEFRFKLRTPDGRFLTSGVALVELSQA
jgi:hypothetical protein